MECLHTSKQTPHGGNGNSRFPVVVQMQLHASCGLGWHAYLVKRGIPSRAVSINIIRATSSLLASVTAIASASADDNAGTSCLLLKHFKQHPRQEITVFCTTRGCVCRFCTSHLRRFKIELPARLRGRKEKHPNNKNHKTTPKQTRTQNRRGNL